MIIDLQKFIHQEEPFWREMETMLDRMERSPAGPLDLDEVQRFHYLYQRASADLAKLMTFSARADIRRYLESLVARAYGEIHQARDDGRRFKPLRWFFGSFPTTVRKHSRALLLSVLVMFSGGLFGGAALLFDYESKQVLIGFSHLRGDPSERVAEEERAVVDRLKGAKGTFSSYLMTHNTRVSILAMGLGITWGVGTILLLFYNGVILGAVAADYILAGETTFLVGWLLPHGSVEIPAILIAGQAGLVIAGALIGNGEATTTRQRFRAVSGDPVTLIFGTATLLVWAGIIESFFSQYHEPVIPYALKIGFGGIQLIGLAAFLSLSGSGNGGSSVERSR